MYHARKSSNGSMNSVQRMKLDLHLRMLCKDASGKTLLNFMIQLHEQLSKKETRPTFEDAEDDKEMDNLPYGHNS
jgi:hypothetical protein